MSAFLENGEGVSTCLLRLSLTKIFLELNCKKMSIYKICSYVHIFVVVAARVFASLF